MSTPETVVTGEVQSSGAPPPAELPKEQAESPPAPVEKAEKPEKSGYESRIDELTKARRTAERERDRSERERDRLYEELQRTRQSSPPPQPTQEPQIKTLADFGWDEKKFAEHLLKQAVPKPEVLREQFREIQEQEAKQRRLESFREREAVFAKEHEDYEEFAYSAPISESVATMLQEVEEGPELAYYLGKNPDIAKRISKLTSGAAGVELGRLLAKLAASKAEAAKPKVSEAPPPTPKVEGADATVAVKSAADPESDKLSASEWAKLREKELRRKRS